MGTRPRSAAESRGGHLATITRAAERDMAVWEPSLNLFGRPTPFSAKLADVARVEGTFSGSMGDLAQLGDSASGLTRDGEVVTALIMDYYVILPRPVTSDQGLWNDHWPLLIPMGTKFPNAEPISSNSATRPIRPWRIRTGMGLTIRSRVITPRIRTTRR